MLFFFRQLRLIIVLEDCRDVLVGQEKTPKFITNASSVFMDISYTKCQNNTVDNFLEKTNNSNYSEAWFKLIRMGLEV